MGWIISMFVVLGVQGWAIATYLPTATGIGQFAAVLLVAATSIITGTVMTFLAGRAGALRSDGES